MSRNYFIDKDTGDKISKKYGLPLKEISCPSCGLMYGHHQTKVCNKCKCCSRCCECSVKESKMIDAEKFIHEILNGE